MVWNIPSWICSILYVKLNNVKYEINFLFKAFYVLLNQIKAFVHERLNNMQFEYWYKAKKKNVKTK